MIITLYKEPETYYNLSNSTHLTFARDLIKHCHRRCDEIDQRMSTCKIFLLTTPNIQLYSCEIFC
jgi:hypothetical protein